MRISVLLPYTDAAKYYRIWGREEKDIDFKLQKRALLQMLVT